MIFSQNTENLKSYRSRKREISLADPPSMPSSSQVAGGARRHCVASHQLTGAMATPRQPLEAALWKT
jgi:hypothetical protein